MPFPQPSLFTLKLQNKSADSDILTNRIMIVWKFEKGNPTIPTSFAQEIFLPILMNILILTPQLPYPPHQGTSLRNFHIIKGLAEQHTITLLSYLMLSLVSIPYWLILTVTFGAISHWVILSKKPLPVKSVHRPCRIKLTQSILKTQKAT